MNTADIELLKRALKELWHLRDMRAASLSEKQRRTDPYINDANEVMCQIEERLGVPIDQRKPK